VPHHLVVVALLDPVVLCRQPCAARRSVPGVEHWCCDGATDWYRQRANGQRSARSWLTICSRVGPPRWRGWTGPRRGGCGRAGPASHTRGSSVGERRRRHVGKRWASGEDRRAGGHTPGPGRAHRGREEDAPPGPTTGAGGRAARGRRPEADASPMTGEHVLLFW